MPLYRQYNPNAKAGSHNYTTNKAENDQLVKLGWKGEGIGWYGVKSDSGTPGGNTPSGENGYTLSLADVAGKYASPFNMEFMYNMTVKADGTFTADFREFHRLDSFAQRAGQSQCWAVQKATGKIRLIKGNESTIGTYQIYDVKFTYKDGEKIQKPTYPDGSPMAADAVGFYYGGTISTLKEGSTFVYYSSKTPSNKLPDSTHSGTGQFCAPGSLTMLLTK